MTTRRDSLLQEIDAVRSEIDRLLDGMDYSFDWKPEEAEWSSREAVYHMVDTPAGGVHTAIQGVLDGSVQEVPVESSQTNLTQERREKDIHEARQDLATVLAGVESALASRSDSELEQKKCVMHSLTRGTREERSVLSLVEGMFLRHWKEHLGQIAALREGLGLE